MFKNPAKIKNNTVLNHLKNGALLEISPDSNGGLILCKRYHAELVGPGAAIGGVLDVDCHQVIPIGNISFNQLLSYQESQEAYDTRQKWIKHLQDLVRVSDPLVRSQKILNLLDRFFNDRPSIERLQDDTLAMLVGVLPKTIAMARNYRQSINNPKPDTKIEKKPYYHSFRGNYFQLSVY